MSISSSTAPSPHVSGGLHSLLRKALGVMFGMSLVNAGNYANNIIFGRYLESDALGDVVLATTCLLVIGAISVAIQSATARGVAGAGGGHGVEEQAIVRSAKQFSYVAGGALFLLLVPFAAPLARTFRVSSLELFWWLGALAPLLLVLGVQRGVLQGRDRTLRLTGTFQAEMGVRLLVSWLALALGFGLRGVCAALLLSVLASLVAAREARARPRIAAAPTASAAWLTRMMAPALVAQLSVIVFTQVDVILVKARATPEQAGIFAVVVLIGRIITFTTQAVSTPLLPAIVARARRRERAGDLLAGALGVVAAVGMPLVAAAVFAPRVVISTLFGAQHLAAAPFLGGYAIAMFIHAVACILTDYAFCHGVSRVNYAAALLGAVKLLAGIAFISDLHSAVLVNLASSTALLALVVTVWLSYRGVENQ